MQVLLVEDDKALAHMVKKRLEAMEMASITVYWKECLADALTFVTAARPDAILLDLGLPDSKGIKGFVKLHEAVPGVPIIIVTASEDNDTVIKAIRWGAQGYIQKGKLNPIAITSLLKQAIERHAIEQQEYQEHRKKLKEALDAVKALRGSTPAQRERTITDVIEAVIEMRSEEGDTIDEDPFE